MVSAKKTKRSELRLHTDTFHNGPTNSVTVNHTDKYKQSHLCLKAEVKFEAHCVTHLLVQNMFKQTNKQTKINN
jgi:hypothetical protein